MRIDRQGDRETGWAWLRAAPDPRLARWIQGPYTGWVEGGSAAVIRREAAKPVVPVRGNSSNTGPRRVASLSAFPDPVCEA
ncbi:MAG: hypothetical protein CMM50_00525 [Rhodospirillaceae bacterium]|nr:hypothetical protein [Rhodospirillaceae bacterium]